MGQNHGGLPRLRFMGGWVLRCEGPAAALNSAYFDARFKVLRAPLGFLPGAARLPDDDDAIHAWIESDEIHVVAVGRIHLIPAGSCGSCADTVDDNAAHCPDFPPLANEGMKDAAGNSFPHPNAMRPAVQIRQMGTLPSYRRQGLAAQILAELELQSVEKFAATTGFLQAREHAIPFYASQGWVIIDEEYTIPGIGPHCSMMKRLVENQ